MKRLSKQKSNSKIRDIKNIRRQLIDWYLKNLRDLPWRHTNDPYRIWVSEVMLQQTQVNTVLPYYRKFFKKFPRLKHLARSKLQDVLKVWEGLGYYGRARNLHRAANVVLEKYNGTVPNTWEEFRQLPGVGDYIAAAVLSIAFGSSYPVVEGNVKRVLARMFLIDAPVNKSNPNKIFKEAAGRLLESQIPGIFNQAMMELGALICKPKDPLCTNCPIQQFCQACQTGKVKEYPQKIKTHPTPVHHIVVGVVVKNKRVLITQRKTEGLLGGLWEFPGGKVRKGESAEAACIREIKEEVNLQISIDRYVTRVRHAYTHFRIVMDVFLCKYISGRVKLNGPVAHSWIMLDKIHGYPFPKANHKFIPLLKQL